MSANLPELSCRAVVFEAPGQLSIKTLELTPPGAADLVVEIDYSGISTGTERLLWQGRMPDFPGMGYPLVPGYESVGRVVHAGPEAPVAPGQRVFVPGALCYGAVRGLFGGAASRVVVDARRVVPISEDLGEQGVLLALAATAYHALASAEGAHAELIVGHGVLGRLLGRIAALNAPTRPVVWERNPERASGADGYGYEVIVPEDDSRHDYRKICDVSGDAAILDSLIARMAPGGEIVLAGFYSQPLTFTFPPAFLRETRLRVAAQWQPGDLAAVKALVDDGRLSLAGLITHRLPAGEAGAAYRTAFDDPACLKMILDWRANP